MSAIPLEQLSDASTFAPPGPDGEIAMGILPVRITGARVVLEWALRSWFTPLMALPWNRGAGVDLRASENASYGPGEDEQLRQQLIDQARAVEYVEGCEVELTRDGRTLLVEGSVTLVDGRSYPLALTLAEGAIAITKIGVTS